MSDLLTEADLMALVAKRYPEPEWAFLRQVRNGTGYTKKTRTADGIALNLWPSRGMELHGFEAKVTRSDWIRELRKPEKSCDIQKYCARWWIVTPKGIVHDGELPPTWGLLEVAGKKRLKLVAKVAAPELKAEELDRAFVGSILRSAARFEFSNDLLDKAREEGYEQARAAQEKREARLGQKQNRRLEDLLKAVRAFEEASGVKIGSRWEAGNIGVAVRAVMDRGPTRLRDSLNHQLQEVTRVRDLLAKALQELCGHD